MLMHKTPTPVIEADPTCPENRKPALPQMIASYHQIAQLKISRVFPGHYERFEDAHQKIREQLGRIHWRKEQALGFVQEGHHDFLSLLRCMYGKNLSIPAVPMMLGYLDILEAEGKIEVKKGKQGLLFFA